MAAHRVPLLCAAAALAVALVPVGAALDAADGHASGLVRMAREDPISTLALRDDPEFRFVDAGAHYDGVYFYAMARDPFARGEAHTLIDKSAYRYGHAGYGWLAGIASLGNPGLIPGALLILALAGFAVAAGVTSKIFEDLGFSGWWGLTVAFNPGLIYAVTALTSETVGAAVLAVSLLLWLRGRTRQAAIALVVLCFMKEPYVLVPVALAAYELILFLRNRKNDDIVERIALLATGPILFAGWYYYLYSVFDKWPFTETEGFFQFPFAGWVESIKQASLLARGPFFESQLGAPSVAFIAMVGALVILGLVFAARLTSPVHAVYIPLALLNSALSPLGVLFPKDLIRELAVPLVLVPLVVASAAAIRARPRLNEHNVTQPTQG